MHRIEPATTNDCCAINKNQNRVNSAFLDNAANLSDIQYIRADRNFFKNITNQEDGLIRVRLRAKRAVDAKPRYVNGCTYLAEPRPNQPNPTLEISLCVTQGEPGCMIKLAPT